MLNESTRKSNDEVIKRKTMKGDLLNLQLDSKSVIVPTESTGNLGPLLSSEKANG